MALRFVVGVAVLAKAVLAVAVLAVTVLVVPLAGCDKLRGTKEIGEKRTVAAPAVQAPSEAKADAKLAAKPGMPPGMGSMPPGMGGMGGMGGMAGSSKQVHDYTWTAPQGWETAPSTPMRMANFKIGSDTECYLTVLSGPAGGVEMNINRWRAQMGMDEKTFTPDELAALPKASLAGKNGVLVELAGTYASMRGQPTPNSLMLAAIAELGGETVFVKMVGPEASVKAQHDAFVAFCASLRQGEKAVEPGDITAPSAGAACPMPGVGGAGSAPATCPAQGAAPATSAPATAPAEAAAPTAPAK